jgi:uncharacterized protein (TIGR03067 family)
MRVHLVALATTCALGSTHRLVLADDQQKGLDQLRGKWVVEKTEPRFDPKQVIFDGNNLTLVFEDGKKQATIQIDSSAKSAQFDIIGNSDKTYGIYELDEDVLRICFFVNGNKRPSEFRAGPGIVLVTIKRERK